MPNSTKIYDSDGNRINKDNPIPTKQSGSVVSHSERDITVSSGSTVDIFEDLEVNSSKFNFLAARDSGPSTDSAIVLDRIEYDDDFNALARMNDIPDTALEGGISKAGLDCLFLLKK